MGETGIIFGILGLVFGVVAWQHARATRRDLVRRCNRLQHDLDNVKAVMLLPTSDEVRAMFPTPDGYGKVIIVADDN